MTIAQDAVTNVVDLSWDTVTVEGFIINSGLVMQEEHFIINNYHGGLVTQEEYKQKILTDLERNVGYAAAFLDEHNPGWSKKITRPLRMGSVYDCVLGQVFAETPRDLFRRRRDNHTNGWMRGILFLAERGFIDRPYVFSSDTAIPFWEAEIAKRG